MGLETVRLKGTPEYPWALEVTRALTLATLLLTHLERLPGLRVVAKFSWPMTDEIWADFTYSEHLFHLQCPLDKIWIAAPPGCPQSEFETVEQHVRGYRWVSPVRFTVALGRYLLLPSPRKHRMRLTQDQP